MINLLRKVSPVFRKLSPATALSKLEKRFEKAEKRYLSKPWAVGRIMEKDNAELALQNFRLEMAIKLEQEHDRPC